MILRSFLRLAARASLIALATASVAVGCSRQGEGERCDLRGTGNEDCDSGLVCVSCLELQGHVTDRCCPPDATGSSDPRCARSTAPAKECLSNLGTGGTTSTGGTAGGAGSAGASSGGAGAGGGAGTAGAASGGTAGEEDPAGAGGA
jgi:hypothetical protein